MKDKYIVQEIDTEEIVSPIFESEREARVWVEENAVDLDFYFIKKLPDNTPRPVSLDPHVPEVLQLDWSRHTVGQRTRLELVEYIAQEKQRSFDEGRAAGVKEERDRIIYELLSDEEDESPEIDCDDPECGCQDLHVDYERAKIRNEKGQEIIAKLSQSTTPPEEGAS